MTKKQILRTVAFLLVVSVLLITLCDLFECSNSHITERFVTYRNLEKDTVDAIFLGTSAIDRYWITPKAYEEYGITAYPLSSDALPSWLLLPLLKYATDKQDISLVMIDMRSFTVSYTPDSKKFDVPSRRIIDALPFFSLTRFEAIDRTIKVRIAENSDGAERFDPSYFFSFIRYHSKWEEDDFSFSELEDNGSDVMGFMLDKKLSIQQLGQYAATVKTDKKQELYPLCEEILYELLDYLKKQDYEVLFLDTPHCYTEIEAQRMNTICDILDQEGFSYLVCDVEDDMYDMATEYYNDGHVNYYGAEKFTKWFSEYLLSSYDLPDRRLDESCHEDWNGTYDNVKKTVAAFEKANQQTQ